MKKRKTIVYIDGFNLYYSLQKKYGKKFLWLDIEGLSKSILRDNQKLEAVKYFTAIIINNTLKKQKQFTYLEAIKEKTKAEIFFGRYQNNPINCRTCNTKWNSPKEKKTDVNIAVQMTADAFLNNFDDALLITRDSDLVPPIEIIRKFCPNKKVGLAVAPGKISFELKQQAHYHFHLYKRSFRNNQLPNKIVKSNGYEIEKPPNWI